MFKTRINLRKLTITSVLILFLWLLFAFSSFIELPKYSDSSKKILDIQNKILKLEKQLDKELTESGKLLNEVKEKLEKPLPRRQDVDSAPWGDSDYQNLHGVTAPVIPVLVMACDRITVKRCIENLVTHRPDKATFPIIISQDCGHNATYQVIKSFVDADSSISVVQQPDLSEIGLAKPMVKFRGYYKIARHFHFALNHVLKKLWYDAVIIVEDDLDIAPDFYEYFLGTYPLLIKDPSIWCISAWNDNGKKSLIDLSHPELLHRTDFFPGLGWMMTRDFWLKMEPNWPPAFFDDWLRDPKNIGGRSCIRPEVSRTYNFGKVGVSKGLFFDLHLRYIQLNLSPVQFTKLDLSYLMKENYDKKLISLIDTIPTLSAEDVMVSTGTSPVKVNYSTAKTYQKAAKKLGLMDDSRSGIPRTAYRGIVTCFIKGRRVYLVPEDKWTSYNPNWS